MSLHPQTDANAGHLAQSPERQTTQAAESGANAAFHNQLSHMTPAEQRLASVGNAKADFGLPDVKFFDSQPGIHSGDKGPAGNAGDKGHPGDRAPESKAAPGAENTPKFGDDLPGRIVKAVGANEGDLTHITKNDNGHGISVGTRQWNQKRGELPDLLKSMHDKDPAKFDSTFGPYAKHLQSEHWVRHADMAGNHDLMKRMNTALHDPEFQRVQIDKAREFAQKSIETAKNYGLKSEQGAAVVADITNQLGEHGARNVLSHAGLRPGGSIANEEAALKRIEHFAKRPNNHERLNTIAASFHNGDPINRPHINDPSVYMT